MDHKTIALLTLIVGKLKQVTLLISDIMEEIENTAQEELKKQEEKGA